MRTSRAADFGIDTTARTTGQAGTAYLRGLRTGELVLLLAASVDVLSRRRSAVAGR